MEGGLIFMEGRNFWRVKLIFQEGSADIFGG